MKNYLDFKRQLEEKRLTAAEKKKREEIAQAIEKKNPDMPMDKKMAIATAQAKKVSEEYEKFVAEMNELGISEQMILEKGIWDNIIGGVYKLGKKLLSKPAEGGAKSVDDILKNTPAKRTQPDDFRAPTDAYKPNKTTAPDDPMGVQGPVVTKPFKDTDAAKEFTTKELDRIQKAVNAGKTGADDIKPPPAMPKAAPLKVEPPKAADDIKPPPGTNKSITAANDDIKPPPPAPKKTQPRDDRGRYVSSVPKAADDIKPPPPAPKVTSAADDIKPPPAPRISTANKVIGGGLALGAAALTADQLLSTPKSPAAPSSAPADDIKPPPAPKAVEPPKAPAIPTDDRARKEPAEPPKAPAIPTDDRARKEPAEPPKADKPNYDGMTFGQAFNAARKAAAEKGAESTGRFTWKGKDYQTNVKGEKYVSRSKQTAVGESFDALPAGSIDEAILMSLTQVKK